MQSVEVPQMPRAFLPDFSGNADFQVVEEHLHLSLCAADPSAREYTVPRLLPEWDKGSRLCRREEYRVHVLNVLTVGSIPVVPEVLYSVVQYNNGC